MKEIVDQLISEGREFLSKNEYEKTLNIFTLIKQYKGFLHAYYYYYYEGFTYLCWGEHTNNITEQQPLYLKAVASLRQAALYTSSKPKDTDFLLGKAFWKAGKLSEAGTVLKKYKPCPEHEEEFQRILSQIPPEPNKTNNSQLLPRENDLSKSQLIVSNNNSDYVTREEYNELKSSMLELRQDVTEIKLTIADVQKILQSANVGYTANINDQIKELKVINPKLEEYYKCFNMALHNVCIAASAVSSGLVVPDAGHLERVSASSLIKWVCYLGDIAASGFLNPIATALIAVLHDAGDNMFNSKEEKKLVDVLTKFCKMINKQSDMTIPVAQDLQKLALLFAHLRSAEITKLDYADTKNSFSNFFETKLPMQSKFFRYDTTDTKEMNDKPIEKQAYKDAIALISLQRPY